MANLRHRTQDCHFTGLQILRDAAASSGRLAGHVFDTGSQIFFC
jgi:hypothetical protein